MITKQRRSIPVITTLLLVLLAFAGVHAGQPALWETSGRTELLKGDARGVSISDTGVLMLAPKLNEVFKQALDEIECVGAIGVSRELDAFKRSSLLRWFRPDGKKLVEPEVVDVSTLVDVSRLV